MTQLPRSNLVDRHDRSIRSMEVFSFTLEIRQTSSKQTLKARYYEEKVAHLPRKPSRYRYLPARSGNQIVPYGHSWQISQSTLAEAKGNRDWRIYADFAQSLIHIARPLYMDENFRLKIFSKTVVPELYGLKETKQELSAIPQWTSSLQLSERQDSDGVFTGNKFSTHKIGAQHQTTRTRFYSRWRNHFDSFHTK